MEAAQVGIFVLQDQRFVTSILFLAGLFGYSEEELIGQHGAARCGRSGAAWPTLIEQMAVAGSRGSSGTATS
jgi:hypothetical protein